MNSDSPSSFGAGLAESDGADWLNAGAFRPIGEGAGGCALKPFW